MTLEKDLESRGLIQQTSAPADTILSHKRTVYVGFDPTADSLQVGNLAVLLLMKRLGDAGFKLVFLVGGGTGMIGDPRDIGERKLLDEKTLVHNRNALKKQIKNILGKQKFTLVDNADWLTRVHLLAFLRDIGKHFSVNDLIKREIIKKRLETPDESISYTEFTYALLQGYDYLLLNEKYGVTLQIGGQDQWTNMISGVELVRKKYQKEVYVLATPLVLDATGRKFGKSEGNAVWLDAKKTSPFQFYQFWVQLPDEGLETYAKAYTFLSLIEINALSELHRRNPQAREMQRTIARLVTEIVHGPKVTAAVVAASDALFGRVPFHEASPEAQQVALAEAPSVTITRAEIENGIALSECLVRGKLAASKSEARRLIEGKAISLTGFPISNPDQKLVANDLPNGFALVKKGKQNVLILILK